MNRILSMELTLAIVVLGSAARQVRAEQMVTSPCPYCYTVPNQVSIAASNAQISKSGITLPSLLSLDATQVHGATVVEGVLTSSSTTGRYYERILTNLHILIQDQGYGLTETDYTLIQGMLDRLPVSQLQGIDQIIIRTRTPNSPTAEVTDHSLVLYLDAGPDFRSDPNWLKLALGQGIGQHLFADLPAVLSPEEKAEWLKLTDEPNSGPDEQASIFGSLYATYVQQGNLMLDYAVTHVQGEGDIPLDKNRLAETLFLISLFAYKSTAVAQMFNYTTTPEVSMTYVKASRTDQWLSIGIYNFLIQNNKITGVTTDNVSNPSQTIHLFPYNVDDQMTVPQTVLDRIPQR